MSTGREKSNMKKRHLVIYTFTLLIEKKPENLPRNCKSNIPFFLCVITIQGRIVHNSEVIDKLRKGRADKQKIRINFFSRQPEIN